MSGTLARSDLRDLAEVERHAQEVLRQCEFLRVNGAGDEIRFGLIALTAWDLWRVAARADRRWSRANGFFSFRWCLPRGYGRDA